MKWALISYPKPLCFILLLPLRIFLASLRPLYTCPRMHTRIQTHTCTRHKQTHRSIVSVSKQLVCVALTYLAGQVREAVCVAPSVASCVQNYPCQGHTEGDSEYATQPLPSPTSCLFKMFIQAHTQPLTEMFTLIHVHTCT